MQDCEDEESRLRKVISTEFSYHLPEFEIALHTGMRRSEQYGATWPNLDFARRVLTVPRSKHGGTRHVHLNSTALAMFKFLQGRASGTDRVFLRMQNDKPLRQNDHWFMDAVKKAGIRHFTWHDLRHTFASRLVMGGVDLRTVSELMGHKNIQMTMRYAHLAPAHQQAAVETLTSFDKPTDTTTGTAEKRTQ